MKSKIVDVLDFNLLHFPCLLEYVDEDNLKIIVLFHKDQCGTVVYTSNKNFHPIGAYIKTWTMKYFRPFTGEIKLTN